MTIHLAGKLDIGTNEAVALLDAYPAMTVATYDYGPSSGHAGIGPSEIGRLLVIEPLSQAVVVSLLHAAVDAPWHLVAVDACLAETSPEDDLYWDGATLFEHFDRLPGVGYAIASKLLHLKRPAFFPILDTIVRRLYDDAARDEYKRSGRGNRELPHADRLYWAAIRADVVRPENQAALSDLRDAFRRSGGLHRRRVAALSDIRLMDMLIWSYGRSRNPVIASA